MNLRKVEVIDLFKLLACNLYNLPENYCMRYWEYVIISWPGLSFLVEDERGKVVGYVLSSIEPEDNGPQARPVGHVNSLSVLRPYRRLGLAQKLMNLSIILEDAILRDNVTVEYIQLHVRRSNIAARSLYEKLGYGYHHTDEKYYIDGEDALVMRLPLQSSNPVQPKRPSPDTERLKNKTWLTNLWHFLYERPHQFVDAAMSLFRRRNP